MATRAGRRVVPAAQLSADGDLSRDKGLGASGWIDSWARAGSTRVTYASCGGQAARKLELVASVALGAEVVPRLVARGSLNEPVPFPDDVPAAQDEALAAAPHTRAFARDWRSPDLDLVLEDIARQGVDRKRRLRARALFETISQHWERFSDTLEAQTAWYPGLGALTSRSLRPGSRLRRPSRGS